MNQNLKDDYDKLEELLDGQDLRVLKTSKRNNQAKNKILTSNKGFIQYQDEKKDCNGIQDQNNQKVNEQEYIENHGYTIQKVGVSINNIKNHEDQKKFDWTDENEKEYYFILQFYLWHKVNYNPDLKVQKEVKEKKKKSPKRIIKWEFKVVQESEVQKIKDRLQQLEKQKQFRHNLKICDAFIKKFDEFELSETYDYIVDTESLEKELKKSNIQVESLGYIYNNLKNCTNKYIVGAAIVAHSYKIYLSQQNKYQKNKLYEIEQILKNLYQGKKMIFSQEAIKVAQEQFKLNIDDEFFLKNDTQLLKALMHHLNFNINFNIKKLIQDLSGFSDCLIFDSLKDLDNEFQFQYNEEFTINYFNFLQRQKTYFEQKVEDENKNEHFKRYCIELFGNDSFFFAKFQFECYQRFNNPYHLNTSYELLKKNVYNQHSLFTDINRLQQELQYHKNSKKYQKNLDIIKEENTTIESKFQSPPSNSPHIKSVINQQITQKSQQISDHNQTKEQILKRDSYYSDKNLYFLTENSETEPYKFQENFGCYQSDEYLFELAKEQEQKGKYKQAYSALDSMQVKSKEVLIFGFKIEKKLYPSKKYQYSDQLFKMLNLMGSAEDLELIGEILKFYFPTYVTNKDINFLDEKWRNLRDYLQKNKSKDDDLFTQNQILIECRVKQIDDVSKYYEDLFENLEKIINKPITQIEQYYQKKLNQFILISDRYFKDKINN